MHTMPLSTKFDVHTFSVSCLSYRNVNNVLPEEQQTLIKRNGIVSFYSDDKT